MFQVGCKIFHASDRLLVHFRDNKALSHIRMGSEYPGAQARYPEPAVNIKLLSGSVIYFFHSNAQLIQDTFRSLYSQFGFAVLVPEGDLEIAVASRNGPQAGPPDPPAFSGR